MIIPCGKNIKKEASSHQNSVSLNLEHLSELLPHVVLFYLCFISINSSTFTFIFINSLSLHSSDLFCSSSGFLIWVLNI